TELLSMEKSGKADVEDQLAQLRATLATAESERDRLKGAAESAGAGAAVAQGKVTELTGQLEGEKKISARALAQVEILNQQIAALRRQLAALEQTLDAAEKKDKEAQNRITELGQRLNLALAERVNELKRYRSDFFGKLREILGNRADVRIVGDRFVLQSEVFFDTGKADLKPEGRAELDKVADALLALEKQIPADLAWVLRVDGHTDVRPISGGVFKSNWDLSAARAISVVQYLIGKGVSPQRLVAAGFGEFQPIDLGKTDDAYSRNRPLESKLPERGARRPSLRAHPPPPMKTRRSNCGAERGPVTIRILISTRVSPGGATAGAMSSCPRRGSS